MRITRFRRPHTAAHHRWGSTREPARGRTRAGTAWAARKTGPLNVVRCTSRRPGLAARASLRSQVVRGPPPGPQTDAEGQRPT